MEDLMTIFANEEAPARFHTCPVDGCFGMAFAGETHCRDCAAEIEWLNKLEAKRELKRLNTPAATAGKEPLKPIETAFYLGAASAMLATLALAVWPYLRDWYLMWFGGN